MRRLKITAVSVYILWLNGISNVVTAQQDLYPGPSVLDTSSLNFDYLLKIRNILVDRPDGSRIEHYVARVICCPSFEPCWALTLAEPDRVLRDDEESTFYLEYVAASRTVTRLNLKDPVTVRLIKKNIQPEMAHMISDIWFRALRRSHYVEPVGGADGIRYHFSRGVPGTDTRGNASPNPGFEQGQAWSPPPGSRANMLVEMSLSLKGFMLEEDKEKEKKLEIKLYKSLTVLKNQ